MPDIERILCLDVGTVRIGVAVSDPTGTIAQPVLSYTRKNRNADIEFLGAVAREQGASLIVSGLPLLLDGTEGEQAAKTRAFVNRASRAWGLDAEFIDERFSTATARGALIEGGVKRSDRKSSIDMLSAVVILQSYLDRRANLKAAQQL